MTKNFLARCRFEPASFDLLMTMPFEPTFWAFRFFDTLATLTREPDAAFGELHTRYTGDERLRVPTTVFNAALNRTESILGL